MDHAPSTETLKAKAGDTIEFVNANLGYNDFDDARFWDCADGRGFCTYFGKQQPPQTFVRPRLWVFAILQAEILTK